MKQDSTVKVLQITSYPPPRAGWGIRVFYLKKEMEKKGYICEVLNIGKSRFLKDRDFIPVFSGFDYVKKILLYRLKGYKIHMHLNGDSPKGFILTILAELISLLTFKRPIITFHAGPVQLYFPQFKAPYLTPIYRIIFHLPKFIICNNDEVKKNIMSYGITGKKIMPIPAFSKQYLKFSQVKVSPEIEKIFNQHFPVIVSYIFLRPVYFIEDMLQAFYHVKQTYNNAYLILMGSNKPENNEFEQYAQKNLQLIKKFKLDDSIYFTGDLDHDSFLTLLSKSILYLRTHIKDGVSSSVLEALSLNIPVVACENGIRPESVITYKNGNIKEMVDKISYVIENNEAIRKNLTKPSIEDTVSKEISLIKKA
ncbi:MAG: glycosyltransferase [Nitrosopumilaceae archaeon]|nr:glycosyltransferase [Nitrosopumilaceae archaeon]NIU88468.1 glycosyltransferase [Nitrosopumilaceae archaeon]NIV66721.1 glycosyltransferase [Nitrosopumilaceae archaeon]NIX62673.1 glycosyltransferase [Nitrosopumilaceae archaeon]